MPQINPYKRPPAGPLLIGLLTDKALVVTEGSSRPRKAAPTGCRVYADPETVTELVREGCGEMLCWSGQPVRWRREVQDEPEWVDRPDDVCVLGVRFPESRVQSMRGLCGWRNHLTAHGAPVGSSLGGSAMNLLKATLREPVITMSGEVPPVEWGVLGPRQLLAPWVPDWPTYRGAIHYDLPAAYPTVMATLPYGGGPIWRKAETVRQAQGWVDSKQRTGSARPLYVEATVAIPELPFGPLPKRPPAELMRTMRDRDINHCELLEGRAVVRYPTSRRLRGCWLWEELHEAEAWGCEVEQLHAAWTLVATTGSSPFLPFYDVTQSGRELPGFAATLMKATANACWGRMVVNPNNTRSRVRKGRKRELVEQKLPPRKGAIPQSWDVGELITAGVRVKALRVLRELGPRLITFHTDGGFAEAGPLPPGWEVKHRARKLQVINPQFLKQWLAGRGAPSYSLAGVPRGREEATWKATWKGAP